MSTRESNPLFASFVPLPVSAHIDFCQVEVLGGESQFALSKKRRIEVHIAAGCRMLTNKFLSDRRLRRLAPGAQFNTIYSHYNPDQSEVLKGQESPVGSTNKVDSYQLHDLTITTCGCLVEAHDTSEHMILKEADVTTSNENKDSFFQRTLARTRL
jgi:hypothetical protein